MALVADIARAWRRPGATFAEIRARPGMSDRVALGYLFMALVVMFAARLPELPALAGPERPLDGMVAALLVGFFILGPLLLYLLAGLAHLIARTLGGQGDGLSSRLALFWALMASSPAVLLAALLRQAFAGLPQVAEMASLASGGVFVWQWWMAMRTAHAGPEAPRTPH